MTITEFKVALTNAIGDKVTCKEVKDMYLFKINETPIGYEYKELIHDLKANSFEAMEVIQNIVNLYTILKLQQTLSDLNDETI